MELTNIIREHFATLSRDGWRLIEFGDLNAWSYINRRTNYNRGYGVFVENIHNIEILEDFANVRITNSFIMMNGVEIPILLMLTDLESSKQEFASLCSHFVELGKDGENRELLQENPHKWVSKWQKLMGNIESTKTIYDVLGELLVVKHLVDSGVDHVWKGPEMSTWDIEGSDFVADVKSTSLKYDSIIQINSQYQLNVDTTLFIYFCRFEQSDVGISINDVVDSLKETSVSIDDIERKLSRMGYERRRTDRDVKFNVLEKRRYTVDDNFPKITLDSFIEGKLPKGVTKVTYSVDLSGILYDDW